MKFATCRVRELASAEERQLTRDHFKVIDLPGPLDDALYKTLPELPRFAIPNVGNPPIGGEPADDTESQQEELVPEVWDMPATEAPRADIDCATLQFAVRVQRKSGRWAPTSCAPGRREANKGRMKC